MTTYSFWSRLRCSKIFTFSCFIIQRFNEAQISRISGSLTFTTLLALVPLLTVALAILSALPAFESISLAFTEFVHSVIVPSGASVVSSYLEEFKNQAGKLTTIGIVMMIVTSLMLLQTIEQTFNRIWYVRRYRSLWIKLPTYWALLTLGPILVSLSLSASSYFFNHSQFLFHYPLLAESLELLWRLALDALGLFLLYKLVPHRLVSSKHALIGSIITACLLEGTKSLFAIYIANFNSYQLIYGAFAAIPVFLLWLYLLWSIILIGALITANLSYWRDDIYLSGNQNSLRFSRILHVLRLLALAQNQSRSLTLAAFHQQSSIGEDELTEILESLSEIEVVHCEGQQWLLQTHPSRISLKDLFIRFIHDPYHALDPIQPCLLPNLDDLDMSLSDWLELSNSEKTKKAA